MCIGLHVKSCQIATIREFSRLIFQTYWNIKFHKNALNGSRVVSCEQTAGHEAKYGFSRKRLKMVYFSCYSKIILKKHCYNELIVTQETLDKRCRGLPREYCISPLYNEIISRLFLTSLLDEVD